MVYNKRQSGFSLTEVLLAAAILSIGMVMIAMVFPVGVKLTTLATERSISTIASNEAFAKIRLYGINPAAALKTNEAENFLNVSLMPYLPANLNNECVYPSILTNTEKRYHWSALCWKVDPDKVKTIVFVNRAMTTNASYYDPATGNPNNLWPSPVRLEVSKDAQKVIKIQSSDENKKFGVSGVLPKAYDFIDEGGQVVDDASGTIYTVMLKKDNLLTLDKDWTGGNPGKIWVVPPAIGSTRYPCIGIYPFKEF